jgi:hypothetical protein
MKEKGIERRYKKQFTPDVTGHITVFNTGRTTWQLAFEPRQEVISEGNCKNMETAKHKCVSAFNHYTKCTPWEIQGEKDN